MNTEHLNHALKLDVDKCIGCTHCIKVCPTEAIRVVSGKASVQADRCVDCGECVRACPYNAFYVDEDDWRQKEQFKYRVALFPSVFIGQFARNHSQESIYGAILKLGFTHVYEVEQPISLLKQITKEYCADSKKTKPFISSYCPAVVRLIQLKFPSLTENIISVKAPHDLSANYIKQSLINRGAEEDEIGIFYISPCVAKMAAVKNPLGEKKSIITGVLNMKEAYNRVMKILETGEVEEVETNFMKRLTRDGIRWGLTTGESKHAKGKSMAIDGIHNVIKFLDRLENDEAPWLSFLEVRACDLSCAGGILLTGNRFLTDDRLRKRAMKFPPAGKVKDLQVTVDLDKLKSKLYSDPIPPKPIMMLDSDMGRALEKLARARNIMCHLPGIDCGACGAPTCQALAEDMVQAKAKMSDCIFLQQTWQTQGKISVQKAFDNIENKWGKNRFMPDCNKKGAKNESL